MGKSPPRPTPPREMAAAQTGANFATAQMNNTMGMMGQQNPFGSLSYSQTGSQSFTDPNTGQSYDVPMFTARTQLAPAQQRIQSLQNEGARRMAATGANRALDIREMGDFSTEGMTERPGYVRTGSALRQRFDQGGPIQTSYEGADDFSADRQRVEDALMDRMNPRLDRDREAMRTQLVNQGIDIGSQAYSAAQEDFGRNVNDARLSAILGAGDEQARMVGMARDAAAFNNQAVGQEFGQNQAAAEFFNRSEMNGFNRRLAAAGYRGDTRDAQMREALQQRALPFQELSSLRTGQPVVPQFNPFTPQGMQPAQIANYMAANDQARVNAWGQRQAAIGSAIGGLGGFFA